MNTAEIPNLKEVYRDKNLGVVAVHMVGEKYVLHSEIFGDAYDPRRLRDAKLVSDRIDVSFRKHGIDKLYTWGITDEQCRYNMYLGFKPTGLEVTGLDIDQPVYEFVKDL